MWGNDGSWIRRRFLEERLRRARGDATWIAVTIFVMAAVTVGTGTSTGDWESLWPVSVPMAVLVVCLALTVLDIRETAREIRKLGGRK